MKKSRTYKARWVLQALITLYVLSFVYQNMTINGEFVGHYFRPIASIPWFIVFGIDFICLSVFEKIDSHETIRLRDLLSRFRSYVIDFGNQKVSTFLWNSFKALMKQIFFSLVFMVPIGALFALVQSLIALMRIG